MACGFFVALILSKHVWLTARHFPLVPVFSRLPPIPYPVDYVLLAGLAILLGLIAASTAPKLYISAFLFLLVVLALLDQCRWQPWTYQYSLMLATLAVFYWKGGRADDEDAALNICRLIMASVYFYSGLQKLNPTFTVTSSLTSWMEKGYCPIRCFKCWQYFLPSSRPVSGSVC